MAKRKQQKVLGRCLLFWDSKREPLPILPASPKNQRLPIARVQRLRDAEQLLEPQGSVVLVLSSWSATAEQLAARLRKKDKWNKQPIFVLTGVKKDPTKKTKKSKTAKIEKVNPPSTYGIKKLSLNGGSKMWSALRTASEKWWKEVHGTAFERRQSPRLSFRVAASCPIVNLTEDLSEHGICFLTDHPYKPSERGVIEIKSLKDTLGQPLAFSVVAIEKIRSGNFQFRVHAKFEGISSVMRQHLRDYMEFLDPDSSSLAF